MFPNIEDKIDTRSAACGGGSVWEDFLSQSTRNIEHLLTNAPALFVIFCIISIMLTSLRINYRPRATVSKVLFMLILILGGSYALGESVGAFGKIHDPLLFSIGICFLSGSFFAYIGFFTSRFA
ncbi:MAG: hypothetical protein WCC40_10590, partial [Rhodomicrobium sp.]